MYLSFFLQYCFLPRYFFIKKFFVWVLSFIITFPSANRVLVFFGPSNWPNLAKTAQIVCAVCSTRGFNFSGKFNFLPPRRCHCFFFVVCQLYPFSASPKSDSTNPSIVCVLFCFLPQPQFFLLAKFAFTWPILSAPTGAFWPNWPKLRPIFGRQFCKNAECTYGSVEFKHVFFLSVYMGSQPLL